MLESDKVTCDQKEMYEQILYKKADEQTYKNAFYMLCELLFKVHGHKVIILLDEYDTPIHDAYVHG